ncbi:Bug family tripartite tricarboxylate transporter substrate binding protein [Plastoroseomonas arctica]|uniref:Tripartite tricarboxylate transporter substrate binding protein n=1 Tax=Plastoroseomonas arctica TaxID=1509237 RepID=A0AAF1JYW7_9PROT|nr:tripartite tricarboxylate transporter substrate-binding protein [Plastoroseomonas arctica]MBR0657289.1 tripartite tricarboxylate transporter substrate binding protein [Plastoroseomonas arctica]
MISRRALPALLAIAGAGSARAQGFPDRPVRVVVPFPPGGITDIMARLLAERLGAEWQKPVIVENRAGGNALIGADAVAKAAPDGHTLLAMTMAHTVNVALFPNAPYDFQRDLAAISVLGSLPLVVTVAENHPARDLAGLAAMTRERSVSCASSGAGSPPNLGLELFRREARSGANLLHVPYRGGAPAVTDLLAGHVEMIVANLPEVIAQLRGGRLRALAVTAPARHALLPGVPTTAEAGMPGLLIGNWTGLMVQAGTPEPVQAAIEAAVLLAIADPGLRQRAAEGGFDMLGWDRARSVRYMREEVARWGAVVAEAGLRPD